jgi:hypothetical protein
MAIPVIGGLVVSTLLTLVVIPVLYLALDRTPLASAPGDVHTPGSVSPSPPQ